MTLEELYYKVGALMREGCRGWEVRFELKDNEHGYDGGDNLHEVERVYADLDTCHVGIEIGNKETPNE